MHCWGDNLTKRGGAVSEVGRSRVREEFREPANPHMRDL